MSRAAFASLILSSTLLLPGIGCKPESNGTGEPIPIKLRLARGQERKQKLAIQQKITHTAMEAEQKSEQNMAYGLDMTVEDVNADGLMNVRIEYSSVLMEMKGGMGDIAFDSENPTKDVNPALMGFQSLVGQDFHVKFNSRGVATEITGAEEMVEAVMEKTEIDPGQREMMKNRFKTQFGDEGLKSLFDLTMSFYPDKPVKLESSWTKRLDIVSGYPHVQKNTYTLKSNKNGVLHIDVDSTISPATDAEAMEMGPMSFKMNLEGSQKGTIQVDEKNGQLLDLHIDQDMHGHATVGGGPDGDVKIPIKIEAKITVETKS